MKTLAKVIAGLLVLVVVAVGAFLALFDPNDYKAEIIQAARDKGSVDLQINGDIGWSLFPSLALELPALDARDLEGKPLASLKQAQIGVALMPLLSGQLKMSGVLIDGLTLDIVKPDAKEKPAAGAKGEADGHGGGGLLLDVGTVEVRNADITYRDPAAGQTIKLTGFNFKTTNLVSAQLFPAHLDFKLELFEGEGAPSFSVNTEFDGQLYLDLAKQQYRAEGLDMKLALKGKPFNGKEVPVRLQGKMGADLGQDRATVEGLKLTLANLTLDADLVVATLAGPSTLSGALKVAPFDLKQLLAALGQPAIATSDDQALRHIGFSTRLEGPANTLGLKDLALQLDDTRFSGELRYDLGTGAQWLRLKGDRLNVDRYLPPRSEQPAPASPAAKGGERYPKTPLFPVELIKTLDVDAQFDLAELMASKLKMENLALVVTAKNGTINVSKVAGDLYQGRFANSAVIDVAKTPVRLTIEKKIQGVQLGGMLVALTEKDLFSGQFDMNGSYQARGNSVYDIVHSLDGTMKFGLKDGRLKGINLTDQLCQGLLKVQGKQPSTTAAADYTEFSNIDGSVKIVKGVADNSDLKASLAGVTLTGAGQVDLPKEALDYGLDLTVLQELKGPNCQIDDKLHNLALPVRCKGSFDDDPAGLCRPDTARMKAVVAGLYGQEAKAKVEAAKEKAKTKVEDKLKSKLKGLFN